MANFPQEEKRTPEGVPDPEGRPDTPPRDEADIALDEILRARAARAAQPSPGEQESADGAPSPEEPAAPEPAAPGPDASAPEEPPAPETPDTRSGPRRFVDRVLYFLGGFVPHRGDSGLEIVRKCVFMVALITLIVSASYIVNDMVIQPVIGEINYEKVRQDYDPENPVDPPADYDPSNYPDGIMDAFKALYAQNSDIRGWMTYTDTDGSWLDIDYPVMYSGDNSYYLTHNFQKAEHKDGALFFDQRNHIDSPGSENKALIVYGHNMASGHMFSKLNDFLNTTYGLSYARSAPVINLDTLYERSQYKVFAVMLLNTRAEDGPYFDYLRTAFTGDADFLDFVANIRARSLFDYGDVDVTAEDELLILSTCTAPSGAKFEDGRCVVVARKVREDESAEVNVYSIVKNEDVIMPQAWYINQDLELHPFYTGDYTIPNSGATGTTTPYTTTTTTTTSAATASQTPPVIVPTPATTTTTTTTRPPASASTTTTTTTTTLPPTTSTTTTTVSPPPEDTTEPSSEPEPSDPAEPEDTTAPPPESGGDPETGDPAAA